MSTSKQTDDNYKEKKISKACTKRSCYSNDEHLNSQKTINLKLAQECEYFRNFAVLLFSST